MAKRMAGSNAPKAAKTSEKASDTSTAPKRTRAKTVAPSMGEDDIRLRAYFLYIERGAAPGQELDDWFEAEKALKPNA
jgi:hypothetical protein